MLVTLQTLLCELIVLFLGGFGDLAQADKFSPIPGGTYEIGNVIGDADITDNPVRSVTLSAYFMAVNDTTKAQWDAVRTWALTHGYSDLAVGGGKASNHPVQTVNWYDVVKWANAASEMDGLEPCYNVKGAVYRTGKGNANAVACNWSANGYRLPTEAEWEVAARGGLTGKRFPWALPTISYKKANYSSNGDGANDLSSPGRHPRHQKGEEPYTSPVGRFAANGFGLYDMAGNVSQWCWDRYGAPYSGGSDPRGAATGSARVLRGGSWLSGWDGVRCAKRKDYRPDSVDSGVGFRLARGRFAVSSVQASEPKEEDSKARRHEYSPDEKEFAVRNEKYSVRWNGDLVTNKTKRVVESLPFFGGYSIRNQPVFSKDGSLLAYSQGGSSLGSRIVIVRLESEGKVTPVVIFDEGSLNGEELPKGLVQAPPPVRLGRVNHVYQSPLLFAAEKFFYCVSADGKPYYFSYDIETKSHIRLKDAPKVN